MEARTLIALRWYPFSAMQPNPEGVAMPFWASIYAVGASK